MRTLVQGELDVGSLKSVLWLFDFARACVFSGGFLAHIKRSTGDRTKTHKPDVFTHGC